MQAYLSGKELEVGADQAPSFYQVRDRALSLSVDKGAVLSALEKLLNDASLAARRSGVTQVPPRATITGSPCTTIPRVRLA